MLARSWFKDHLPQFDVPAGQTADELLEVLCREGVRRLYGHDGGEVGARLDYELGVIRSMGFTNYFLVVWDFVKFAKDNGISWTRPRFGGG